MDLFGRKKRATLKRDLLIASQKAEYWEKQYNELVCNCVKLQQGIQDYLQSVFIGKYYKFDLFDIKVNQVIQHKIHVLDVSYAGGVISFHVQEGEQELDYKVHWNVLDSFKQISKKTYLS